MADLGWGIDEDETCQQLVLPALAAAGWSDDQIRRQYQINDGKLLAGTREHRREDPLWADYALEYDEDLVIAVVEAKRTRKNADDGIEQARRYARRLDVPFAYATNGDTIFEVDALTGRIEEIEAYPSPDELWRRYRGQQGIESDVQVELEKTPFDHQLRNSNNTPKRPRYYQRVAVNRAVRAIARGDDRLLLTLATGTGKTFVAYLIVAKLREVGWPPGRKPKVLYLADRNVLVDQPKDDYFARVYGDLVHKITGGTAKWGRQIYFALYQSLENGDEQALFKQYPSDFFDLVIVDECHRGSARESSGWRNILQHYAPATQLGLTATPVRKADADTHSYFTNEVYEYSLKDGIEDGYLAPYRVRKVRLNIDMTGWRPEPGQRDLHGAEIPDRLYTPRDYEKRLNIVERTEEAARYMTEYLRRTGRMGKTIVFCEDTDHAGRMMRALNNLNDDKTKQYWNYVCRITSQDGAPGQEQLAAFKRIDTDAPVIAVTSRLLSTGVDMPAVRNIALFRRINSTPEFKQIIGRGTRLCPDVHKGSFDIIDFTEATVKFNDPDFDGPPIRVVTDQEDDSGGFDETVEEDAETSGEPVDEAVAEPGSEYVEQDEGAWDDGEEPEREREITDPEEVERVRAHGKRLVVKGVEVYVWGEARYELQSDGQSLKLVGYRQFVRDRVLELDLSPDDLRSRWAAARSRRELRQALSERGVEPEELNAELQHPEADPLDLLLHVAWEMPLITREERAVRLRREHREFLESFGVRAREVLERILEKYAAHGASELEPSALKVAPFDQMGTLSDLAGRFGGSSELGRALDNLGRHLYDVA